MIIKDELLTELNEIKYSIQNNKFDKVETYGLLEKINSTASNLSSINNDVKNSQIRNLLITFNIKNYSDLTILFVNSSEKMKMLETAGSDILFEEFNLLYEADNYFFKNTESIKVKGSHFRIFYESMENEKGNYTILTITESVFFKPSKFHMLADIIMEIIRSIDMSRASIFNDLFEETIIGINSYLAAADVESLDFFLFKFENIYDFFLKMGLEIIIELSETIKEKLKEIFGEKVSIFRFSLSEYIVIVSIDTSSAISFSDLNNRNVFDFNYKGIVLQHRCIKISHHNKSIYDVFETIFKADNKI